MTDEIARHVDRTLEAPFPTRTSIEQLCHEARERKYHGIVLPSSCLAAATGFLEESGVRICCMIGNPFGAMDSDAKRYETEVALDAGAQEIELVPSLGRLKDGDYKFVLREIRDVVESADERPVNVAIEAALWSEAILREVAQMILESGAHLISTGSIGGPAKVEEIRLLRAMVGAQFGLKATGLAITDAVEPFIAAGANRVGLGHLPQNL